MNPMVETYLRFDWSTIRMTGMMFFRQISFRIVTRLAMILGMFLVEDDLRNVPITPLDMIFWESDTLKYFLEFKKMPSTLLNDAGHSYKVKKDR